MNNLQKQLNEKRKIESEQQGFDMVGCMLHCEKCDYADHTYSTEYGRCYATQENINENNLCAKAYELIKRR